MFITAVSMVLIGVTPCCCISKGVIRDCDHVYSRCSCGMGVTYHIAYKESCSHGIFYHCCRVTSNYRQFWISWTQKYPT